MAVVDTITPLLQNDTVDGVVDHRGSPCTRSNTGGWKSASCIIGVEITERIAYYGVGSNLISYLTGPLGQSTAAAAAAVNAWFGVSSLLPLLGAAVADSFLGRFPTIVLASILYILGLALLTLSAVMWSSAKTYQNVSASSTSQIVLFFVSLYLVALGQGGHKPCVQAFGADQFDGQHPEESKARRSFFNWWYFGMNIGVLFSYSVLFYIQDNVGWGLGFGVPCILMALGLLILLLGRRTYRYHHHATGTEQSSPFLRIGNGFVALARNCRSSKSRSSDYHVPPPQLESQKEGGKIENVEDAKAVLKLLPIWLTSLAYAVAFAQTSTFFTKQGATMDRSTGISDFIIPAASLQSFTALSILVTVSVYDSLLAPLTMLQRIGSGMVLAAVAMIVAALVEIKRVNTAIVHGMVDSPVLPMSFWWLVPQYVLWGMADSLTMVGLQEFFYSQVPDDIRSVGLSFYLSIIGVGNLLSSFLVSLIGSTWFPDNLNRGHLDYFYLSLAALQIIVFIVFLHCSKSYVYARKAVDV